MNWLTELVYYIEHYAKRIAYIPDQPLRTWHTHTITYSELAQDDLSYVADNAVRIRIPTADHVIHTYMFNNKIYTNVGLSA